MGFVHVGDIRYLLRNKGEFRRTIPVLQRLFHFLGSAILNLFKPWVEDHDIMEYRKNWRRSHRIETWIFISVVHPGRDRDKN